MAMLSDVLTSSQTWVLKTPAEYRDLLHDLVNRLHGRSWLHYTSWQPHTGVDEEWSGPGLYRLQVRLNRPEGRPLYSLKWEGV